MRHTHKKDLNCGEEIIEMISANSFSFEILIHAYIHTSVSSRANTLLALTKNERQRNLHTNTERRDIQFFVVADFREILEK